MSREYPSGVYFGSNIKGIVMLVRLALIAAIGLGSAIALGYGSKLSVDHSGTPPPSSMAAVGDSGPLDGMTFTGELGPEGRPKDVTDVFVFSNGTFVSKECELRCDYPARPYFINEHKDATEFVSNTKCPYKDAEITWHGKVKGDRIVGTATWTIRRWYWTMTNTFEFAGTLEEQPDNLANADSH